MQLPLRASAARLAVRLSARLSVLFPLLLVPLLPAQAATMIGGATQDYLILVTDGTSNTVRFGETATPTRITFCFDNVASGAITDGTSNTIVFGEGVQLQVTGGSAGPRQPINPISDGLSNTVLFGDFPTTDFCIADVTVLPVPVLDGSSNTILVGETSTYDACFDNVSRGPGRIIDGTSNTIVFGEVESNACYYGAVRSLAAVSMPEAPSLALLGFPLAALAGLGLARRRRPAATA